MLLKIYKNQLPTSMIDENSQKELSLSPSLSLSPMICSYRPWKVSTWASEAGWHCCWDFCLFVCFFFIEFPRKQAPSEESDKSRSTLTNDGYHWLLQVPANNYSYDFPWWDRWMESAVISQLFMFLYFPPIVFGFWLHFQ